MRLLFLVLLIGLCAAPLAAQDVPVYVSLVTETTTLQTGQEYTVSIQIENAPPAWSLNLEMAYDPRQLYIFGTQSGQPVT
ncbi:MAG: hypothetical protein K8I30_00360, partial [Anaerolineae bacterium]|nr:hypothetical protein [Anaerolineae bacterium]